MCLRAILQYNRGRRAPVDSWVFGIVSNESTPSKGYYQVVEKRDRATLLPIIDRCLKPGSEIHTDDWGAYDNLRQHIPHKVARHRVVNHSLNFVDPATAAHTQQIESKWNQLKQPIKARGGIAREDLQSYLNERMWKEWRGGTEVLDHFFDAVALCYLNISV